MTSSSHGAIMWGSAIQNCATKSVVAMGGETCVRRERVIAWVNSRCGRDTRWCRRGDIRRACQNCPWGMVGYFWCEVLSGTRDGARAGRPSRRRMPSIDMNRLASGAVLCFVIKSLGFSVPGSLNSLRSLERTRCWTGRPWLGGAPARGLDACICRSRQ